MAQLFVNSALKFTPAFVDSLIFFVPTIFTISFKFIPQFVNDVQKFVSFISFAEENSFLIKIKILYFSFKYISTQ